jgi:hypothetical protein
LYLWQIEDLLRALQLSPEAIYSQLVATRQIDEEQKHIYLLWYMDIVNLLRKEGKEESGHLEHTLHLIGDMHNLHLQLMQNPVGEHYRKTYQPLAVTMPRLRQLVDDSSIGEINDTELCFRALYATLLYKIKGGADAVVRDTLDVISPVIGELAAIFHKAERGELDLFEE